MKTTYRLWEVPYSDRQARDRIQASRRLGRLATGRERQKFRLPGCLSPKLGTTRSLTCQWMPVCKVTIRCARVHIKKLLRKYISHIFSLKQGYHIISWFSNSNPLHWNRKRIITFMNFHFSQNTYVFLWMSWKGTHSKRGSEENREL